MNKRRVKTLLGLGMVAWLLVLLRFANLPFWSDWRNEQLLHAVQSRNVEGVTFWLETGADANVTVYADYRPLDLLGESATFSTLPEENHLTVRRPLLLTAVTSGPKEKRAAVVAALLTHGANANASTAGTGGFLYNTVPLKEAFLTNDKETVCVLIGHGANGNIEGKNFGNRLIFDVIFDEDHALLGLLLQHGTNQSTDRDGATPLQRAAEIGDAEALRILLEHGAKVDERDRGSKTALMFAARCSQFMPSTQDSQDGAIKFLLGRGANVEARDATGKTALMVAAQNGQRTASRLLLNAGANPNAKDNKGERPADYLSGGIYWSPTRF